MLTVPDNATFWVVQLHVPFVHPDGHTLPQVPQLFELVRRLTSQPLDTTPSQLPKPALQVMLHEPPKQLGEPLALLHTVPHAPQLVTLVVTFVSHPLLWALLSQLPKPALHVMLQEPSAQFLVPFAALHTTPQEPQFVTLVCVEVSHPFGLLPSQFP